MWFGLLPSFLLSRSPGRSHRCLGAFVLAIVVRMAGATGEKKERAEALLAHQALHDMLTGLPNRALFYERTEDVLDPAGRDGSVHRGHALRSRPVQGDQRHHGPQVRRPGTHRGRAPGEVGAPGRRHPGPTGR